MCEVRTAHGQGRRAFPAPAAPGDFAGNAVRENAHAVAGGKLRVAAAYYDLDTGQVDFL